MSIAEAPPRARTDANNGKKPAKRRSFKLSKQQIAALCFAAPLFLYLIIFYAAPLVQNVSMSLHRYDRSSFVYGGAPFVGTDIYTEVIQSGKFGAILTQTAIFVVVSIVFQYGIGLALAVFFYRKFPLSEVLRGLFLVPWLLPVIVSGTSWQWMMNPDNGILNKFIEALGGEGVWWLNSDNALMSVTIANIWLGIPFCLVILYSGLQNIPEELYEAASLDGAGPARKFRAITFPLLKPVSLITVLLGLIYTLKVVDIIWILTMGAGTSQTLATWSYSMAFGKGSSSIIKYSEASAVGSILLVIALVFGLIYIALQRKQED